MVEEMIITSPVFRYNEKVSSRYTCEGENISPPLSFREVPQNSKSLLLMLEDPSAEAKPWIHWCVFNIPPYIRDFSEGEIPEGAVEGITCTNKYGYDAPCPGNGKDFVFKLYALDTELSLPGDSDRKVILKAIMGHVLSEAQLVVRYAVHKNRHSYSQ